MVKAVNTFAEIDLGRHVAGCTPRAARDLCGFWHCGMPGTKYEQFSVEGPCVNGNRIVGARKAYAAVRSGISGFVAGLPLRNR